MMQYYNSGSIHPYSFAKPFAILILCLLSSSLHAQNTSFPSLGDSTFKVFTDYHLYFDPSQTIPTSSVLKANDAHLGDMKSDIFKLDGGRTILKKVILPDYARHADINIKLSLVSSGDPWDKLGSVFVLKPEDLAAFLELSSKESVPRAEFPGVKLSSAYRPPVELLRFLTPFGIGYYNDSMEARRPSYIPKWAGEAEWNQDVSPLGGLLRGTVWIGVFIDCWTAEGYQFDLEIQFDESELACDPPEKRRVIPLVNTIKYLGEQRLYDGFNRNPLEVPFTAPFDLPSKATMYYTATGHGGHSEGDEFHPHQNRIYIGDTELYSYTPWRDDCASFRRFNPHAGVWTQNVAWKGDSIPERIASSDFSRSGWCPGSSVTPETIPFEITGPNTQVFRFEVEKAQAIRENEYNYWAVSAWLLLE